MEEPKLFCTDEQFEFFRQQDLKRTAIVQSQKDEAIGAMMQVLHAFSNPPKNRIPISERSFSAYMTRKNKR